MKKIVLISIAFAFFAQTAFSQKTAAIRTLKADFEYVSIKEGEILNKDAYAISAEVKPDVFVANKFTGKKKITFISGIDSLTFEVTPNKIYDFVILFNGKRAYTRIDTFADKKPSIPLRKINSYVRADRNKNTEPDEIPFKIGEDQRIYIEGTINDSEPLNFIFDTGASSNVVTSSLIGEKVQLKLDGEQKNGGSDGIAAVKTSSSNQLEINGLVWNDVNFLAINYQGEKFDGVLGWTEFENKIVEINYDRKVLIIYDSIGALSPDYSRFEMKILRGVPYIKGSIIIGDKEKTGWFEFDTGSDWSLSLSQKFAGENSLNDAMKKVGSSISSGSTGVKYEQTVVLSPKLKLGEFEMYQVPISIYKVDPEKVKYNDILGNLLLKRFNAVIDFKNYSIYLKPNNLMHTPYPSNLVVRTHRSKLIQ